MGNPSQFLSSLFKVSAKTETATALPDEICCQFSLTEIKAATNNFHPKSLIGEGRFGTMYKGVVGDGKLVAVKRAISGQGYGFQTEGQLLCQLRHQHLVSLIGYCNDKDEKILVYEFMKNGTLYDHLHGSGYDPLPWKQRLEICIGVARGLHYLHTGAKHSIIHRDVKTSIVLFDDKWVVKLSAFGLSKMRTKPSYSNASKALKKIESRVAGTVGYLDPEYARNGELSEKSDVFSFGVVLFEVLCGRPTYVQTPDAGLLSWVFRCIREGSIYDIIDPYLKGRIAPESLKIFVDIASQCISLKGDTRPEIGEVELMLELAMEMQEKADSEIRDVDPYAEPMYGQVPFCISDHIPLAGRDDYAAEFETEAEDLDSSSPAEDLDSSSPSLGSLESTTTTRNTRRKLWPLFCLGNQV